ncbi:MAG: outer membrane beta-barrel protein [Bacteroidales bacterium]|nr:outer membrane beta-barrel protein [Bacteroidales bacterium]
MSKLNGHIDKLFRDAAGNYRQQPPEEVWDRVQATLKERKHKKRIVMYRRLAAAAIILLMVSIGFFLINEKTDVQQAKQEQIAQQEHHPEIQQETDQVPSVEPPKHITHRQQDEHLEQAGIISKPETNIEQIQITKREQTSAHAIRSLKSKTLLALNTQVDHSIDNAYSDQKNIVLGEDEEMDKEQATAEKSKGQWSVTGSFSPAYSYRNLRQANGFPQSQYIQNTSYYNDAEEAILGVVGGVTVEYTNNSPWEFSLGLNYSVSGHMANQLATYYSPAESGNEFTTSTSLGPVQVNAAKIDSKVPSLSKEQQGSNNAYMSYRVDGYLNNASIIHRFHYIEIPFIASYKLIDRKFDVSASIGVNAGILMNKDAYIRKDGLEVELKNFDAIGSNIYNALMGLNFEYPINRKFALSLQPTFKFAISPLAKLEGFKYMPYQYYLATGVSYQF